MDTTMERYPHKHVMLAVAVSIAWLWGVVSSGPDRVVASIPIEIKSINAPPSSRWYLGYPVTKEDIGCLALNIYFEARGESIEAQYAVADVVLHRTMHYNFPNTVCGVIRDGVYSSWHPDLPLKWRCSFTWWCDRKSDKPRDKEAYEVAKYIATDVLTNPDYVPEVEYALYYHAEYVNPTWASTKTFVKQLDKHLFYY